MSTGSVGEFRCDRYNLVWYCDTDGIFKPFMNNDSGAQMALAEMGNARWTIAAFDPQEDPSGEDPRIAARLDRIEFMLCKVLEQMEIPK